MVNVASICSAAFEESLGHQQQQSDIESPLINHEQPTKANQSSTGNIDLANHFTTTSNYRMFDESFDLTISLNNSFDKQIIPKQAKEGSQVMSLSQYTSVWNQVCVLCYRSIIVTKKNAALVMVTFIRHVGA